MFTLLILVLILDSLVLATVVLLQAGKGGGLAAMGGGASTESFFGGRQATTILTKLSWWCGGMFLFISLVLSALSARTAVPRSVLDGQIQTPTPIQLPLPANPSTGVLRDSTGN